VRDRSNKNLTVLQNYFLVNLHDWITDSQIDMANSSNRAGERDSVSDSKDEACHSPSSSISSRSVYRKPERERIGDEIRQGYCVKL